MFVSLTLMDCMMAPRGRKANGASGILEVSGGASQEAGDDVTKEWDNQFLPDLRLRVDMGGRDC